MASTTELVTESVEDLATRGIKSVTIDDENREKKKKKFTKMSVQERISYIKEVITVEPLLSCYLLASVLCSAAINNLEFEKSCRANQDYNDTICEAILTGTFREQNFTKENEAVQQQIIKMHSWQTGVQSVMPVILILFLGSYSDRHKIRKPFLVLPIIGELFAIAGIILCVVFMRQWPLEVQGFVQTVIPSLFGGPTMIIMACFAYIADVSTLEMRTLRVGIVQIVLNACTPIAQFLSGILFVSVGYIGVFLIAGSIYSIGLLYGFLWIKEPKKPVNVENKKNLIKDIFDVSDALETLKVLTKKTQGNNRFGIIIIMIILFSYTGVVAGEGNVFFLFTQTVFEWTVLEFSFFLTVNTVIHLIGAIAALALLSTVLKLEDLTITVISFLDKIACNIIFIIFVSEAGLYTGTVVSAIIALANIAIRSQATKVVSPDDLGKAQSIFGIVETVAPSIVTPIYNQGIYTNTLETFPAAFFILGIVAYAIGIVLLMWMYFEQKARKSDRTNGIQAKNGKLEVMAETTTTHF